MVRAAAMLFSLALHALAVVAAGTLWAARPALAMRAGSADAVAPVRPVRVPQQRRPALAQRTGAPPQERDRRRSAGALALALRTHAHAQPDETKAAPQLPAPAALAVSRAAPPADGDSARRPRPGRQDLVPWSTLRIVETGQARAPAPSPFCVPRAPAMPEEAVEQEVSGRVVARFDVGVSGVVSQIEFVNRPPEALAGAVRDWLRGCLFEPAMLNGRRVPARQEQSFLFILR